MTPRLIPATALSNPPLTYDLNGNLTSDGINTYSWDARNRLAAISGGNSASFQYDAGGRRTTKTINSAQTGFLYDGFTPVQELNGTTVVANLLTGLGIDEYLTRTDTGGSSHFLADALGSTVALSDGAGALPTTYTYAPFGATSLGGSATGNVFDYTGREDDGTGLKYYRARYYSPTLHRFLSEDPIGLLAGPNLYSYVGNAPANFIDPFGLDKKRGWSFTLEGYWGWGGGVVFGKNPNDRYFVTTRYGYGYGGGLSYNPRGTSPGYDPATNPQVASGLGVYADIGAGVGPVAVGASAELGYNVGWSDEFGFIQPYSTVTPQATVEAETSLRLRFGGAVGVQVPLVGIELPNIEW